MQAWRLHGTLISTFSKEGSVMIGNYWRQISVISISIILFSINILHTTVLVKGNATQPQTFTQPVNAKVFDRATGTFYVGLKAGAGTSAISKVPRSNFAELPQFKAIATDSLLNGKEIEQLTLATSEGNRSPNLALVAKDASDFLFTQTAVIISSNDGKNVQQSPTLKAANPTANMDGENTNGIVSMAANNAFIFVAVRPSDASFGDENSGIALVSINQDTLALAQVPAVAGDTGIKAQQLDATIDQVNISPDGGMNNPLIVPNRAAMHWDDKLQRLYIGLQLSTADNGDNGDGANAVVVARVDNNCTLVLESFVPNNALINGEANRIVAAKQNANNPLDLAIAHIHTMHCSTGASYLIINGGNGTISPIGDPPMDTGTVGNLIFALPTVDTNNPNDVNQGILANKNNFNATTARFDSPVDNTTGGNNQLTKPDDLFAQVGNGSLPIQSSTNISDIVVIGDTVYVSINTVQSDKNDTGIFYSQALFDEEGKIIRWTPWVKRAFPFDGFPDNTTCQGRVAFFAVDAVSSKIFAVDGSTAQTVRLTAWDRGNTEVSLARRVSSVLTNGSFSALDLDQATRGFVNNTMSRYALFGGANQIVFAQTSKALGNEIDSPQTVITDFSDPANFLKTELPKNSGCVQTLEYSRRTDDEGPQNYFFAGTENGFFVFADANGNGFNVNELGNLNTTPFMGRGWQKIDTLPGSIIAIQTTGRSLYVLTFETTNNKPLKSKLFNIPFDNDIATMFAQNNIRLMAESEEESFSSIQLFLGINIIATMADGTTEQLVLSTNSGLFKSSRIGGIQQNDTDQLNAQWQRINAGGATMYADIIGINTPASSTVWPISVQDEKGLKTFERSSIHQLSGTMDAGPFNFVPSKFNAIELTSAFETLDPITHFWSDGARRLFVINRQKDPATINKLLSFPFDTKEWNIQNPAQHVLFDPVLANTSRFFWVKQIGVTGILMAGTNEGVVALE